MSVDWCVVRTKPRRERWAKFNVERQGNRCLLPLFQPCDEKHPRPLFPSYLFVQLNQGHWWFLKSTFGCLTPIMRSESPAPVPERVMQDLLTACNDDGLMAITKYEYSPGDLIRIKGGSFINQIGTISALASHDRVKVLLQLLGAETPVILSRGYIEPLQA